MLSTRRRVTRRAATASGAVVRTFNRTQTRITLDLFNALNSAAVLGYKQTYSPTTTTWLTPTSVLGARIAKIGVSVDF